MPHALIPDTLPPATHIQLTARVSDDQGNDIVIERKSQDATYQNGVAMAVSVLLGIGVPVPVLVSQLRGHAAILESAFGLVQDHAHLPTQHSGRN